MGNFWFYLYNMANLLTHKLNSHEFNNVLQQVNVNEAIDKQVVTETEQVIIRKCSEFSYRLAQKQQ